jgi:hypothetical protein
VPWYNYSPTPSGIQPVVAIRLLHGAQQVQLYAIVDSGADASLLNIEYADLLGLDRVDAIGTPARVASGDEVTVFNWPDGLLQMQFQQHRFPFLGNFIEFPPKGDGDNLMGRKDFFANFIVQFWDARKLMNIDLSPDHPEGVIGLAP